MAWYEKMDLLEMCLQASVIILAVIVCRALFINKLPKKVFLILWGVALSRLLIPYSLPSVLSIYSLAGQNRFIMEKAESIIDKAEEKQEHGKNVIIKEDSKKTVQNENNIIKKFSGNTGKSTSFSIWKFIWFTGFIISISVFIIAYILCYRRFCTSLPVNNRFVKEWLKSHKTIRHLSVRQSGFIKSPLSYGIFCPVILMPEKTSWEVTEKITYILEHEFVHIKRFDAVIKLFLIIAASIYWFNPLVWVMYILVNRDIEISCDETVVRHFGEKSKAAYALVLISMEEEKSGIVPLGNSFSKNAAEERITAIMQIKKFSKAAYIKAFLLIAIVVPVFATSEKSTGSQREDIPVKKEIKNTEKEIKQEIQEKETAVYSNVVGEIAAGIAGKGDYDALYDIAPFVKQEDLDNIAKQIAAKGDYDALEGFAYFLSKDVIHEIAKQLSDEGNYNELKDIAPFL